ncbi:MAG: protease inhibitor I42 family protein [Candidatus Margulisbacteria bacterium]|nr:protease inhibitor I42 family protein [Candidatus Margulisiibacteriota bacterium]
MRRIVLFIILLLVLGAGLVLAKEAVEIINTGVNKIFKVELASNPTTGFMWQIDKKPDSRLVRSIGSTYEAPKTKLVGAGGRELWTFKALKPGKTTIAFKYVRSWEKNVPPAETRVFDIKISR